MINKQTQKKILQWVLIVLLAAAAIAGIYFLLKHYGLLEILSSQEKLQEYVAGFGIWAPIVFVLLQMMQVIIAPIPGNVTTLAGGALFGFWPAIIYSSVAIFLGSLIAFAIGKYGGRPLINRLVSPQIVDKYLNVLAQKQRLTLALMFLFPFFPDDVLCFVAGMAGYSWRYFTVMIIATRPWGLVFSALIGSGALQMPIWAWAIIVCVAAACLFLSAKYGAQLEEWLLARIRKTERRSANAPNKA